MHASTEGDKRMVEVLLTKSDKNLKSNSGQKAYDFALNEGHVEIASLLK